MAIINISRQSNSLGTEISAEVADKLKYKLIDKYEINNKVEDFYSDFSAELSDIANEKEPGFFKHFFRNPLVYNCILKSILLEESSHDNIVIIGRGGQYVLKNLNYVLNVRIIAPGHIRSAELMKKQNVNQDIAEKLIEKHDHERFHFIDFIFKEDVSNSEAYDLVISTEKFSRDYIVDMICDCATAINKGQPIADAEKDALMRQSLEKKVEATLREEVADHVHLEVKCEKKYGDIMISGYVSDEIERNKIYKLAKSCPGINEVLNELDTIRLHKP